MTSSTIPASRLTRCRGCGRPVMFVTTKDGKKVPLDVAAPVFTRVHDPDTGSGFWMQDQTEESFVSHFATCPEANRFSGRGRRRT